MEKLLKAIGAAALLMIIAFIFNAGVLGYRLFIAIFTGLEVYLICSTAWFYYRHRASHNTSGREYVIKMIARCMGICFISGTILSTLAFPAIEEYYATSYNNTELIVRSLICSLDMFMLDVDSNILDRLDHHPLLKAALVVQAGLSFLCTASLLVSLVYSRVQAYYKLHRKTKVSGEKNHIYLFFGLNENSKLLAKSIHKFDGAAIVIFVDDANLKDDESDSWSNIVHLFTHRQKTFDFVDESSGLVAIAPKQLCDIDDDRMNDTDTDVLGMMELDKVKKLIMDLQKLPDPQSAKEEQSAGTKESDGKKPTASKKQLHVFFLSDNEDNNLRSLMTLSKDTTILSCAKKDGTTVKIYCHARYNSPNRVVEDMVLRKGIDAEIVDSSHLAIELLKSEGANQPVRVAEMSKEHPTMVERPLEALIVGFGEVGRDAFRFLYEFGTFIMPGKEVPRTAAPHITAIDSKMDGLDGAFIAGMPGIEFDSDGLTLSKTDCYARDFYDKVLSEQACRTINYIVLALSDDDQNIALAISIFNRIRRYRDDMSHLIIMVRCVSDGKRKMMDKIAAHYNNGCGDKNLHVMRIFGNPHEIYSYNNIVLRAFETRGITFCENYLRMINEDGSWKTRRENLTGIDKAKDGNIPNANIDDLRELRRKEGQDMANSLHAATKLWLLQNAFGKDYDWKAFAGRMFRADGHPTICGKAADIKYEGLSDYENMTMLNLAMLEHARWEAAHKLLGYVRNDAETHCNERTQRHNCIRPWQELDAESVRASTAIKPRDYKANDFNVVHTSIDLWKGSLGKISEYPRQKNTATINSNEPIPTETR